MALLSPGEYQLQRKTGLQNGKSMFFVKFTDSAHRTLKDFLDNKINGSPVIEFNESSGILQIPSTIGCNSLGEVRMASFNFCISSNITMEGEKGRLESVKFQSGCESLLLCGALTKRIRILANEDVYETTKNRMAQVDQEQRKVCTKQIDMNLENVNHKLTIIKTKKVATSSKTKQVFESAIKPQILANVKNQHSGANKATNQIFKKPLRERLIHVLAIRPRKRLEIFAIIEKDGQRESDLLNWKKILEKIAKMENNVYHLKIQLWSEVQEEWPLYNKQEKQLVKRNKFQYLSFASSDNKNYTISTQSSTAHDNSSYQYKRPGYFNSVDGLQTKKHRISHFNRYSSRTGDDLKPVCDINSIPENFSNGGMKFCDKKTKKSNTSNPIVLKEYIRTTSKLQECNRNDSKRTRVHSNKLSETNNEEIVDAKISLKLKEDISNFRYPAENELPLVKSGNCDISLYILRNELENPGIGDSQFEQSPYISDYDTIITPVQRRSYKDDFSRFFTEYELLEKEVTPIIRIFEPALKELWPQEKNSSKFKEIVECINEKYEHVKEKVFEEKICRYFQLHAVLSHIKKLVNEYDEKIVLS